MPSSNGSCSSTELPYPSFPHSHSRSTSARQSYATTSPPTPNADRLFFRPPQSSPSTPTVPYNDDSSRQQASTSSSSKAKQNRRRISMMNNSLSAEDGPNTPDTANYFAKLPETTEGVFVGTGVDARSLADMLSPPDSTSTTSKRKKKKGKHEEKIKERQKPSRSTKSSAQTTLSTSTSVNSPVIPSPPATPPPLPPKPLNSMTPRSTRTTATTDTSLTHSLSLSRSSAGASQYTESEVHSPQTALHGRRASASSHNILSKPSLQSLITSQHPNQPNSAGLLPTHMGIQVPDPSESLDHEGNRRDSFKLAEALAALPWAEPPPRRNSSTRLAVRSHSRPNSSTVRAEAIEQSSAKTPTYSFLSSDPTAPNSRTGDGEALSRRSSASSSKHHSPLSQDADGEISTRTPLSPRRSSRAPSVPYSPTSASHSSAHPCEAGERRFSANSACSGIADIPTPLASGLNDSPITDQYSPNSIMATGTGTGSGTGRRSPGSTMATQGSSVHRSASRSDRGLGKGFGGWSFHNRSRSSSRTRSTKSVKSTKSTKSKRGSLTTLAQHFSGPNRWEIRKWEELHDEDTKDLVRRKAQEESMDISALIGRAVVLERMLKSGKRVSSQSVRQLLRSITPSSHPSNCPPIPAHPVPSQKKHSKHRSTPSASISVSTIANGRSKKRGKSDHGHQPSFSNSLTVSVSSHSKSFSLSLSRSPSSSPGKSDSMDSSRRRSTPGPSRGSMSLRERLARKLHRGESREDIFTELDSRESHEGLEDEDDWDDPTLFPPRRTRSGFVTADVNAEVIRIEKSGDRVGGKGVMVFPEEMETYTGVDGGIRPISPPEKARVQDKVRDHSSQLGNRCRANCTRGCGTSTSLGMGCLTPTSPTPLLPHADTEFYHRSYNHGHGKDVRYQYQLDLEKGPVSMADRESTEPQMPMYDSNGRPYYPQSPHLGHRSPNWKNRQSVLSYISTGVWEDRAKRRWRIALAVAAGLVVLLMMGLLIGLLVGKDDA